MLQLPRLYRSCLLTCSLTSLCCNCLSSFAPVYLPVHSLLCAATASALSHLSTYLFTHSSVLQLSQLYHSCLLTCSLLCAATVSLTALSLLSTYLFISLCCNCLSSIAPVNLTKLLKVYKPTHQLCSFYDTSILSSLCVHTLAWLEIFFLCSTVCLE